MIRRRIAKHGGMRVIGAFLGFSIGAALTATLIWPWAGSFVPDVGSPWWQIAIAAGAGTIAGLISFFLGGFIGTLIRRAVSRLANEHRDHGRLSFPRYGAGFAVWGAFFAFTFILGRYLGGTAGRVLVCLGPGLGVTALTTILGFVLHQRLSSARRRRREAVEEQKNEMINMIDKALGDRE